MTNWKADLLKPKFVQVQVNPLHITKTLKEIENTTLSTPL